MDLSDYIVNENELLSIAVDKMCQNKNKGLIIVDEFETVVGTFTRKDLVKCSHCFGIQDVRVGDFANKNFSYCVNQLSDEAKHSNHTLIPIVTSNNRLLDIFFPIKVRTIESNKYPVVINAGGKGTRLYPYTKLLPKPLVPVIDDIPMVELIMNSFHEKGVNDFHMIINYKKEMIKEYFNGIEKDYSLSFEEESKPLGTGGGLCYVKDSLKDTFYLTNCDILMLEDYGEVYQFHKESKNVVTMVVSLKPIRVPYGVVKADAFQNLVSTIEKPTYMLLVNTGIYIVEPEIFDYIGNEENIGFPTIIDRVKADGKQVGIYPITYDRWLDMGQVDELQKTKLVLDKMSKEK